MSVPQLVACNPGCCTACARRARRARLLLHALALPPVLPARRRLRGGNELSRLAVSPTRPHEALLLGRQVAGPGRRQLPAGEEDPARGGAAG